MCDQNLVHLLHMCCNAKHAHKKIDNISILSFTSFRPVNNNERSATNRVDLLWSWSIVQKQKQIISASSFFNIHFHKMPNAVLIRTLIIILFSSLPSTFFSLPSFTYDSLHIIIVTQRLPLLNILVCVCICRFQKNVRKWTYLFAWQCALHWMQYYLLWTLQVVLMCTVLMIEPTQPALIPFLYSHQMVLFPHCSVCSNNPLFAVLIHMIQLCVYYTFECVYNTYTRKYTRHRTYRGLKQPLLGACSKPSQTNWTNKHKNLLI